MRLGFIPIILLVGSAFLIIGAYAIQKIATAPSGNQQETRLFGKSFGSLLGGTGVSGSNVSDLSSAYRKQSPTPATSVNNQPASVSTAPITSPAAKVPSSSVQPTPTSSPVVGESSCGSYNDPVSLRDFLFCAFGVNADAANRIKNTTTIKLATDCSCWYGSSREVHILDLAREGALHELSHAFWEDERGDANKRLTLVKDLIKLGTTNDPNYSNATKFAHDYMYGIGDWKGMFCDYGNNRCVGKDPVTLSDSEIINYTANWQILDHEIYAGFASWTMGKFYDGPHKLPDFMAAHFTKEFSGKVIAVPYYEFGPR
ncbi:MAG TPA: hypothetical protein VLE91_02000 [Candidatus Saccharimonadales bacterium]|nr:hypothetical protein [Candidatus Saccharimonadales bacterium]